MAHAITPAQGTAGGRRAARPCGVWIHKGQATTCGLTPEARPHAKPRECARVRGGAQVILSGIFLPAPITGFRAVKAGLLTATYIEVRHLMRLRNPRAPVAWQSPHVSSGCAPSARLPRQQQQCRPLPAWRTGRQPGPLWAAVCVPSAAAMSPAGTGRPAHSLGASLGVLRLPLALSSCPSAGAGGDAAQAELLGLHPNPVRMRMLGVSGGVAGALRHVCPWRRAFACPRSLPGHAQGLLACPCAICGFITSLGLRPLPLSSARLALAAGRTPSASPSWPPRATCTAAWPARWRQRSTGTRTSKRCPPPHGAQGLGLAFGTCWA